MIDRAHRRYLAEKKLKTNSRLLANISPDLLKFIKGRHHEGKLKKGVYFCNCSICKPRRHIGNSIGKIYKFKKRKEIELSAIPKGVGL